MCEPKTHIAGVLDALFSNNHIQHAMNPPYNMRLQYISSDYFFPANCFYFEI